MKIHIIDPGLNSKTGHHYDIDVRVAVELASRGHHVNIHTHRDFASAKDIPGLNNVEFTPLFSLNPYAIASPPLNDPWAGDLRYFRQAIHAFSEDLKQVTRADIWLLPTVFPHQLTALARLDSLPFVVGCIHTHPNFQFNQGQMLWRIAFLESENKADRIKLGVLEKELLLEYEQLFANESQSIHPWPLPHDGAPSSRLRTELRTVGLLGHQRATKGLQLLPQIVNNLLQLGYEVILQDSEGKLAAQFKSSKNLRVFNFVPSIGDLIQECDAVLLNYDPVFYRYSGSGIAWESIACGAPILAPAGTTVSRLIREYQTGATFCPNNPASMYRMLNTVRDDFPTYSENARQASATYKATHGTAKLVDKILSMIPS